MIEQILPSEVAAAEAFSDRFDGELFPEEEAVIAQAVRRRRQEFTSGRACARAALARLGLPPVPILPGERGAPQWPPGVTGSITHCEGYRAAAVARVGDVVTLGVDAEPDQPLPEGVLGMISSTAERVRLGKLGQPRQQVQAIVAGQPACWDRVLFSAKESVYKAWFPVARRWLDFEQADVTIDPGHDGALDESPDVTTGSFTARLLVPGVAIDGRQVRELTGRWLAARGLVLTAVVIRLRQPPPRQP